MQKKVQTLEFDRLRYDNDDNYVYLAVVHVEPLPDYHLKLTFKNGEIRVFDMNPYLHSGIFKELKDTYIFNTVRVSFDTIEWENGADLDPEMLFAESKAIESQLASESKTEYKTK